MLSTEVWAALVLSFRYCSEKNTKFTTELFIRALCSTDGWTKSVVNRSGYNPRELKLSNRYQVPSVPLEAFDTLDFWDNTGFIRPVDVLISLVGSNENIKSLDKNLLSQEIAVFVEHPTVATQEEDENPVSIKLVESFCENLTLEESFVIPMEEEERKVLNVLSRRSQNNVIVIGKNGVGKTSLLTSVCNRLIQGAVPASIQNSSIFAIKPHLIIADVAYRGAAETRASAVMDSLERRGECILALDDIVDFDKTFMMSLQFSFLPILMRHMDSDIGIFATASESDWRYLRDHHHGLSDKFQVVRVTDTTVERTIDILSGLKKQYESYHHVLVPSDLVGNISRMSARYVSGGMPGKAVNIMDESMVLASEEKHAAVRKSEDNTDALVHEALEINDFNRAADAMSKHKCIVESPVLTYEHVSRCVSDLTGIPVSRLSENDRQRLLSLESRMKSKVIGQNTVIESIVKSLKAAGSGIRMQDRPIGAFLFFGPSGVGKTVTARRLAEFVYSTKRAFLTLNMSEFSQEYLVTRLIGSSPGYIGSDKGGQLTNFIERHPYSLILFDEAEKAHPNVFNLLLQIMDSGRLSDSSGKSFDFTNSIIVLTTNLGVRRNSRMKEVGFEKHRSMTADQVLSSRAMEEIKKFFRPEFLNRLDGILHFKSLTKSELEKIVNVEIEEMNEELKLHPLKPQVYLTKTAVSAVVEKAMTGESYPNARPLERIINTEIRDRLSNLILNKDIAEGARISFSARGKTISCKT